MAITDNSVQPPIEPRTMWGSSVHISIFSVERTPSQNPDGRSLDIDDGIMLASAAKPSRLTGVAAMQARIIASKTSEQTALAKRPCRFLEKLEPGTACAGFGERSPVNG
jgi:hypothetical protein